MFYYKNNLVIIFDTVNKFRKIFYKKSLLKHSTLYIKYMPDIFIEKDIRKNLPKNVSIDWIKNNENGTGFIVATSINDAKNILNNYNHNYIKIVPSFKKIPTKQELDNELDLIKYNYDSYLYEDDFTFYDNNTRIIVL